MILKTKFYKKIIFDTPMEIWPPILYLASLESSQIDLLQNPILFCNYLGPLLSHRNGFVCKMCVWILVFRREKNYLKIGYLVAEILSKMHIGTPCMHFLIFGGPKPQQFSWETNNFFFKYHNFPILLSIFTIIENYQFLIRGSVLAGKTVANLW